jgi:hypothetical protein
MLNPNDAATLILNDAQHQGEYRLGRIAGPTVVLGSDSPQRKQFGNVVGCRDTKADVVRQ